MTTDPASIPHPNLSLDREPASHTSGGEQSRSSPSITEGRQARRCKPATWTFWWS
jgi:hypothetical protein